MSTKKERREEALWASRIRHQLLPKIKASAYTICINPAEPDPKAAVELGYMILLDKPIITITAGRPVPEHLRRVSDLILDGEPGPEMAQAIKDWTDANGHLWKADPQ